ncbi:unnamed protein product [Medioppia subpectinata]|uniref:SAM domain-containing protein n=1 Tax=Medioppia subpectinata TaxID=1979941 RepID=A0A7R9PU22_9ACAR|nr:unnamed protein product [Medioppia subpectinata]CAG2101286.1 unnamed protein product [Medioppia subpectinata]
MITHVLLQVLVVLVLQVRTLVSQPQQPQQTSGISCTGVGCDGRWSCQELDYCGDVLGFEAIQWLHRQLDDDHNGNVDISESNEFLRDELKYENGHERHKAFHGNDKYITVDELWRAWKGSVVRNWTSDETIDWLCNVVELPQYVAQFENNAVDGLALPRLAANTQFISILGITNAIHKQKLALKAMDVVLFGAPKHHNYIKDVLLMFSVVIAIGGVWFAFVQHKYSQSHLKKMIADMDSLQRAEEQLIGLQRELDKTRREQQIVVIEKVNLEKKLKENESQIERSASYTALEDMSRICELEEELKRVGEQLVRAQNNSGGSSSRWAPPLSLQQWLQLTHEIEMRNFNAKRCAAELQLYAAKEGCEKLRKKRASVLGAFRVAHGNSIDDVDNRILEAKTALKEVTRDLQERVQRWHHIEMYCGFSVVHNPGIVYLEQALYGSAANSLSGSVPTLGLSHAGSETTIVDEDSLDVSESMANINDIGLNTDKISLHSFNANSSHQKNLNDLMATNATTRGSDHLDDTSWPDPLNGRTQTIDPFTTGKGIKGDTKDANSRYRPKMAKSFSEEQECGHTFEETNDSLCHSESCTQLETCQLLHSLPINPSCSANYITNNSINNNNKSELSEHSEPNNKMVSSEKKRSFFGLRKRKN